MFQYSQAVRLDQSITEAWTTDNDVDYWSMIDSLGNRSRIAQVVLTNALNIKERRYFIMQRVRILDSYGATVFVGRIMSVEPNHSASLLVLTCRDYLGDLADKIVEAADGDGTYAAATRNGLVAKLVEDETAEPESGQDIDRSLLPRMLQDTGNYLESITKTYSLRGQYGLDPETRGPAAYNYRGTKTVLEAISEIAAEDAQQDLQVFTYTNAPLDIDGAKVANDPKKHPTTYWTDNTASLSDGKEYFSTLRHTTNSSVPAAIIANPSSTLTGGETASDTSMAVVDGSGFLAGDVATIETVFELDEDVLITNVSSNTLTVTRGYSGTTAVVHLTGDLIRVKSPSRPTDQDILYFGSNSKFDGIEYEFRQSGSKIHESNYTDLEWQYWNGNNWERFVPDHDTLFKVDESSTAEVKGRATWRSLIEDTSNCFTETGRNTFPTTATDGSHGSVTFNVDSTANLSVGSIVTIDSEQMKITAINSAINFRAIRAYGGTASATHTNNSVVKGGHKQGMSDWKKRDLDQSHDMQQYNNWNANTNKGWRDWRNPWQGDKRGLANYKMSTGSNRLTFLNDTYPKGTLAKHALRNGDKLRFANFAGVEDLESTYASTGYGGGFSYGWTGGSNYYSWTGIQNGLQSFVVPTGLHSPMIVFCGTMRATHPRATGGVPSFVYRFNSESASQSSSGITYANTGPVRLTYQSQPQMGDALYIWYMKDPAPGTYYFQMATQNGSQNVNPGTQVFFTARLFSGIDLGATPTFATQTSTGRGVGEVRSYSSGDSHDWNDGGSGPGGTTSQGTTVNFAITEAQVAFPTNPGDYVVTVADYMGAIESQGIPNLTANSTGGSYNQWLGRNRSTWSLGSDANTAFGVDSSATNNRGGARFSAGHVTASTTAATTTVTYAVSGGSSSSAYAVPSDTTTGGWLRNMCGLVVPALTSMDAKFINGTHYTEVIDPYSVKLWSGYSPSATANDSFSTAISNTSNQTFTEAAAININESPAQIVGSTRPDDVNSTSIASLTEGGGRGTNRYWVRCWVRSSSTETTAAEAINNTESAIDVAAAYLFSPDDVVTVDREDMIVRIVKTSKISEDLDTSETGIDVENGSLFVVGETITVDSEQMVVGSISSNTLTVVRGHNATAAVSHVNGTPIVTNSAAQLEVTRGYNNTGIVAHSSGVAMTGSRPANLSTVSIATKPNLFRDFRADDPKFFNEVWRYTRDISSTLSSALASSGSTIAVTDGAAFEQGDVLTIDSEDVSVAGFLSANVLVTVRGYNGTTSASHLSGAQISASLGNETNHSIPGGTWLSLNTDGGNTVTGSPLMWSAVGGTAAWLSNNTEQILLGSEDPFNGVELHAVQGNTYAISAITAASSAAVTTLSEHGLTTGDYVLITGSNSGIDIDGYNQVTVTSTTVFTISVNTSSGAAGTLGLVRTGIPDYSNCDLKFEILDSFPRQYWEIPADGRLSYDHTGWRTVQATMDNYDDLSWSGRSHVGVNTLNAKHFPLGALGPTRWRIDTGSPLTNENHWYCEVRFNTDKPRNNIALRNVKENPDRILPPTYPFRQITNDEYDLAYSMSLNSAWNERASLLHPYTAYQYKGVAAHDSSIARHHATDMAYSSLAYVSSTTTMTITFSDAHHCAVGDWIKITGSDAASGTNGWDGVFKVTAVTNRKTLVFDRGVAGTSVTASGTIGFVRVSKPPSAKSMYWLRMRTHQKPNKPAVIRSVKSASTARFKYFDRGKEPWRTNDSLRMNGSASNSNLDALYHYNTDKSIGRIGVTSITAQNGYAKLTTASAHGLSVGETIEYIDTVSTGYNGVWQVVRVIDADEFVIGRAYVSETLAGSYMHKTRFMDSTIESHSPHSSKTVNIDHSSIGNPGTITTEVAHNLRAGDNIIFAGTSSSPPPLTSSFPTQNEVYRVREVISGTQFIYEAAGGRDVANGSTVNVTSAITTGTVTKHLGIATITNANPCKITTQAAHELVAGHRITIVQTEDTTPSINIETVVKEVLSDTEFTIYVDTSGGNAGAANTGYITPATAVILEKPASTNWVVNDAVYFGKKTPFNQLRFSFPTLMNYFGGSQNSALSGVWEYYKADNKGNSANWVALDVNDLTSNWQGDKLGLAKNDPENLHVEWAMPGFGLWKVCMPGQKDTTSADTGQTLHLDKRFGDAAYFVRYRVTTVTGTHASNSGLMQVTADQVWCGPNTWDPSSEVGTLSGVSSDRHTNILGDFGLTLDDREKSLNDGSYAQVVGYELKDHALEFINSVTVRGRSGSYASARDEDSIKHYRLVKEKIIDDPSLTNDTQCLQRARAALQQLKPVVPLNIINISAANPMEITTGGRTKYLVWADSNNPSNIELFDTRGIAITSNSTEGDLAISELAVAITSTSATGVTVSDGSDFAAGQLIAIDSEVMSINSVSGNALDCVRAALGTTAATHLINSQVATPNRTYVTTNSPHGLKSGDKVLITDVSNTAPRFQGAGAFSTTGGENTASYNYIHTVWVASQNQFYVQTASAAVSSLDTYPISHHMSDLTSASFDVTTSLDDSNDAVGAMVHVQARTDLQEGDMVRIVGSVTSGANGSKTVSSVTNDGATIRLDGLGAGTTPTDILGYALIAEPHNLTTGDRVLIRNSSSLPSIDGYRRITRTSASTFTVDLSGTAGRAGISGSIRPTSIREAAIRIAGFPVYAVGGMPKVLRAGDSVEVSLENAGITNEEWLVYSIKYASGESEITLFRDRDSVAEPGDAEKKLLRDLSTHIRETANAVFQPIDKSVETGLDFIPEGPGRLTTKLEYAATNNLNQIDVPNPGSRAGEHNQTFPDDFRLSFRMYENYSTREFSDKDILRIDGQGLRPDGTGPATGGGGLTFIARDKTLGVDGATPDFHPGEGEATLYLRRSGTRNQGSGLYLAHRGVFSDADAYDEWQSDTPKAQAEVFVGLSGRKAADSNGNLVIALPQLTSNPRILANCESNGYVQITTNGTTSVTLTARDAAGNGINGSAINYVVLFNSTKNTDGLNSHF